MSVCLCVCVSVRVSVCVSRLPLRKMIITAMNDNDTQYTLNYSTVSDWTFYAKMASSSFLAVNHTYTMNTKRLKDKNKLPSLWHNCQQGNPDGAALFYLPISPHSLRSLDN